MIIAGRSAPAEKGATFEVLNPATAQLVARAPDCTQRQLDAAVECANEAQREWRTRSWMDRAQCLRNMADVLDSNCDELKSLLTSEQGKPLHEAAAEIRSAANVLRSTATLELAVDIVTSGTKRIETHRVPLGVVAAIPPWNFPLTLAAMKIAPALLAGNAVVLKPSPFTPLTTLRAGEFLQTVLPPGVLNVLSGTDRLGPWLTEHPGIAKISFTGSTETGRKVMRSAAAGLKHITLELGGNDPAIVLPDADISEITTRLFRSAFRNAGQVCVATKRLYIHRSIYADMLESLANFARTVNVGNGAATGTQMGPLANKPQHRRVDALLQECRAAGNRIILSGAMRAGPGYFAPIALIDNPSEESRIVKDEQFGPILPLLPFGDVTDVISRVNNSPYGLGASIWGTDLDWMSSIVAKLEVGNVWINDSPAMHPLAAFGGHRHSGVGAHGGRDGLLANTAPKSIFSRTVDRSSALPEEESSSSST